MNLEEAGSFEEELGSNPDLKEEYEQVSFAFRLIRDQLRKRDEDSFRSRLLEVMEQSSLPIQHKSSRHLSSWYWLLPLAGSLAILLAVSQMDHRPERIMAKFFHPATDPVVLAYNQESRGDSISGISYYKKGRYLESMEMMSQLLARDPENQVAQLFYLLSSMELDLQDDALVKVLAHPINTEFSLGQSLTWYATLSLIKSGRLEEAATQLRPLADQPGPYHTYASRLQKRFLK